MFIVACFIQSSSLLTSFFVSITKQDSWMVVILGFLVSIPSLIIYTYIMKVFPNKNLIEINRTVFGAVIGNMISILYIWFFLTLASLNTKDLGDFVQRTIMKNTPSILIISIFLLLCAWAVRAGIKVVTRYSMFFTLITLFIVVVTIFFISNQIKVDNLLPAFQLPTKAYVQGTHIISTIPFGEIVVFLMLNPNLDIKPREKRKYFFYGFLISGVTLLIIVLRDITVLGNTIEIFALPSFETFRLISIDYTISRVEVLLAVSLIVLLFFKISILYYVTVISIAYLFRLQSFKNLVMSVGVIIVIYSFNLYPSLTEHIKSGTNVVPFEWIVFETIIPFVIAIVIKIKKPHKLERETIQ